MARIDADNDDLVRYVVRRYASIRSAGSDATGSSPPSTMNGSGAQFWTNPLPGWDGTGPLAWSLIPAIITPGWCWSPATGADSRTGD